MFIRKRVRPPLFISKQTRDANPVGALSFAFDTPYFTPSPVTGSGINAGSYRQEGGHVIGQAQNGVQLSYGGLYTGTYALQPLRAENYVTESATL